MHWQTTRFSIDLTQPRIMGIVNLTPDSFSDGGAHNTTTRALRHCEKLLKEGAHILDIGGESTRPGAPPVPLHEELRRVLPVLRGALQMGVALSVDTYKPEMMRAALEAGADIINDIWALRRAGASDAVAQHASCGVCLMHMHGDPQSMQLSPMQGDAVPVVRAFLNDAAAALHARGVARKRIVIDPGIGFGKTPQQNFALLAQQRSLCAQGWPLLAGWSRKSSLGAVCAHEGSGPPPPQERLGASVAAALLAVQHGARIVRVHDVAATAQALAVLAAVQGA